MNALGYDTPEEVAQAVKRVTSGKDGCLLWEEFLDFFFLRQASLQGINGGDSWWRQIGNSEKKDSQTAQAEEGVASARNNSPNKKAAVNAPRYGGGQSYGYEDPDKKPVRMTEQLRILQETRQGKVASEVEEEFKQKMA